MVLKLKVASIRVILGAVLSCHHATAAYFGAVTALSLEGVESDTTMLLAPQAHPNNRTRELRNKNQ